jgi:hypothetical protein
MKDLTEQSIGGHMLQRGRISRCRISGLWPSPA